MTTATLENRTETGKKEIMAKSFDGKYEAKAGAFDQIILGYTVGSKVYTSSINLNQSACQIQYNIGSEIILSSLSVIRRDIKGMAFDGYKLKVDTLLDIDGAEVDHTLEYDLPYHFRRVDAALKRKAEGRLSFFEVIGAFFSGNLIKYTNSSEN